jgi:hypothetical protein
VTDGHKLRVFEIKALSRTFENKGGKEKIFVICTLQQILSPEGGGVEIKKYRMAGT